MTVQAWIQENYLYVAASLPDEHAAARNLAMGEFLPQYNVWRFSATPNVAGALIQTYGSHQTYDSQFGALVAAWRRMRETQATHTLVWPESVKSYGKFEPWQHQKDSLAFIESQFMRGKSAAIFSGMGTGKSLVVIATVAKMGKARTLIVCPKSMIRSWETMFERDAPGVARVIALDSKAGTLDKRAELLYQAAIDADQEGKPFVAVVNYEGFWQRKLGATILEAGFNLVCLDESHRIKSPGGQASRFAQRLGARTPLRMALTGTPLHHSPLDIYAQYRFLDPEIFGTSFAKFKARYAVEENGSKFRRVVGFQNQEELSDKMYRAAFRVDESVVKLPEFFPHNKWIDLDPATRKLYNDFETRLAVELDEGETAATNALVKLLRLRQITSGYLPLEKFDEATNEVTRTLKVVGEEKYAAMVELLGDLPQSEPVVVYCVFHQDLDRIRQAAEATGRTYRELSGRADEWMRFQNDDTGGEVIGVQVRSGNAGVELFRSRYVVYYSLGYSLGDWQQSVKRVYRPGQNQTTHAFYLLARETVDVKTRRAIQLRKSIAEYVVDGLRTGQPVTEEEIDEAEETAPV